MNTKTKGELSEIKVMAALMERGDVVLQPVGDNQRYDLVIERDGKFHRVQVKTARFFQDTVSFRVNSNYGHRGRPAVPYTGQVEFFGVYCPYNGKCYLIPADEVGIAEVRLRLGPPKNNQSTGVRYAKDYEILAPERGVEE